MDLVKYIIAGGISLLLGVLAIIFSESFFSGILLFFLLFGAYILVNVLKTINKKTPVSDKTDNTDN